MEVKETTTFTTNKIDKKEQKAEYLNNKAIDLIALKKYKKAKRCLKRSLRIKHDYKIAYYNLGILFSILNDKNEAILYYSKAVDIDQNYTDAIVNRAYTYLKVELYDLAVKDFSISIKLEPLNEKLLLDRGLIYINHLDNTIKAKDDFEKLIQINPKNNDAYYNAGLCYFELKEFKKSKDYLLKSKDLGHDKAYSSLDKLFCHMCYEPINNKNNIVFHVDRILNSQVLIGDINNKPSFIGFDVGFSDVNKIRPIGNFYFYKLDGNTFTKRLCSLKCAYEYSQENNTLMFYSDPDNNENVRCVTPHIVDINNNFGNPDIYRGQLTRIKLNN